MINNKCNTSLPPPPQDSYPLFLDGNDKTLRTNKTKKIVPVIMTSRTPLGTALRTTTTAVSAVSGLTCPVRAQGFITLHSYGQKILYPWAYTNVRPDDFDRLDRVAKSMSAKIYEKTLKTYETGSAASVLYRISGKPFFLGPT